MGLDVVELVMRLEEEFNLEIADEDAELLTTVGAMDDYVARKLNLSPEERPETWRRVCAVVADEAEVPPESISRSTRVVEDLNFD